MKKLLFLILLLLPFFSCHKEDINTELTNDDISEELFLKVWEYDTFNNQNLKTGYHWNYFIKDINNSSLVFANQDSTLYEYQIIQDEYFNVYFSENDNINKKYEYKKSNNLEEIKVFHQNIFIGKFVFNYENNKLKSIHKDDTPLITDIYYNNGNIIKIKCQNDYFHFKIGEGKNPFNGLFRNFNLNNIYTESLFTIVSYLNPNFVLDAICVSDSDYDWNNSNVKIISEVNENNYPYFIYEYRYDTQGNLTSKKILYEYEYY